MKSLLTIFRARSKEKLETRRRTFESEAVSKKGRDDANMILEDRLNEEEEMSRMDEPSAEKDVANEQVIVTGEPVEEVDEEDEGAMPAPQVRLGPDGQIILDDMSLVLKLFINRILNAKSYLYFKIYAGKINL